MRTTYDEQLERIQKGFFRIRSNPDLIGIGVMADMIEGYRPMPKVLRDRQGNRRQIEGEMATDGENLFFNPEWVAELRDSEIRFILLHEMYHIAWHHHLRMHDKLNEDIANIAMDAVINAALRKTKAFTSGFITWPEGGYYEERFDGPEWYWEAVYRVLKSEMPEQPQCGGGEGEDDEHTTWIATDNPPEGGEGKGRGGKKPKDGDDLIDLRSDPDGGNGEEQDDNQDHDSGPENSMAGEDGDDDDDDLDSGDGDGDGEGDGDDGDGDGDGDGGGGSSGGDEADEGVGSPRWGAVWRGQPKNAQEEREEAEAIEAKLAEGQFMEKTFGRGGGTDQIVGQIRDSNRHVSSWDFIREYLTDVYADIRTWARPNVIYQDDYYPAREKASGTLHICYDTSGSMSQGELELSFANTRAICDELGLHTLKVAYVDDQIRMPHGETWTEYDVASGEEIVFDIVGRGGTHFDPIFNAIEEEMEEVTCLIYFTDGEGGCYVSEPDYPVIWATTHCAPMWWGEDGPFGEVIDIAKDLRREEVYY